MKSLGRRVLALCVLASLFLSVSAHAQATRKIVFLVSSNGNAYHVSNGGHEYLMGAQVWTNALAQRGHAVTTVVQYQWPQDPSVFNDADAIVMYGNGGGIFGDTQPDHCQNDFIKNGVMDKLMQVANRGVPIAMVHYIMEPPTALNWSGLGMPPVYGTNEIKRWIGGLYASYWIVPDHQIGSWNEEWTPNMSLPAHPINQGISPYAINDEWYANIWFNNLGTVSPFMQGTGHTRAPSTPETIGWAYVRPDGTRGFGWTGGHYYTNWNESLIVSAAAKTATRTNLTMLVNAVEWLARVGETNPFQTVVSAGSTWKYDADGSMDANWNQASFNDGAWNSGAAPLGYDDWNQDWIVSQVAAGSQGNRPITTWFRKSFTIASLSNVTNLLVKINADDGAVVYLNGTEIGRYNMPGGSVTSSTLANSSNEINWSSIFMVCPYSGTDWNNATPSQQAIWAAQREATFTDYNTPEFNWGRILSGLGNLVVGTNVLAVEVHQKDSSNPDMRLDVEAQLLGDSAFVPGNTSQNPSAPTVNTASGASGLTAFTATLNGNVTSTGLVPTQVSIVWGTADGGTSLGAWQNIVSLGVRTVGAVSTSISSLNSGTPYFYRVYATNSVGPSWSSVSTFTTPTPPPSSFVAYNDVAWISGQLSSNITTFGIGSTGTLVSAASGVPLNVQVSLSGVNYALWPGSGAGYAPPGTPAAQMLPTNVVDSVIHYYFDSATATFSGLVPTNLYTFVLYANRDGGYTDRYTTVEIQSADGFTNSSSVGAVSQSSTTTTIFTGSSHGNIFRYDHVNPGVDGTVTFQLTGYKPCLNSFMVQTPSTNANAGTATFQQLPNGSVWKYADNGADWGSTAWTTVSYSQDTNWPVGIAPLGYGGAGSVVSNSVGTLMRYGTDPANKIPAYYLRKPIKVTDVNLLPANVAFNAQVDDGAIVYLNGTAVWYYFMTNSGVTYQTLALQQKGGGETNVYTFTVPRSSFVNGTNIIAVEVHQGATNSSDVYFNLWADDLSSTSSVPTLSQQGTLSYGTNQVATGTSTGDWIAYNDTAWTTMTNVNIPAGDPSYGLFTTNSPWTMKSGPLVDATTTTQLAAQVSFAGSVVCSLLDRAYTVPFNSDAESIFAEHIGTNCAANWTAGNVIMTVSGLESSRQYNIVLWSTRGADGTQYSNRFTDITISGADSFLNHSSTGVQLMTNSMANDGVRMRSPMAGGRVARYDNVSPGSDGTVVFTLTAGADALYPASNPYVTNGYLNAFMIQTVPVAGTNTLPDSWRIQYFGSTNAANAGVFEDFDHDGFSNFAEWRAGTDPTNSGSRLEFMGEATVSTQSTQIVVSWSGVNGKTYSLLSASNLTAGWSTYQSAIPGVSPLNVVTVSVGTSKSFWRVKVE